MPLNDLDYSSSSSGRMFLEALIFQPLATFCPESLLLQWPRFALVNSPGLLFVFTRPLQMELLTDGGRCLTIFGLYHSAQALPTLLPALQGMKA